MLREIKDGSPILPVHYSLRLIRNTPPTCDYDTRTDLTDKCIVYKKNGEPKLQYVFSLLAGVETIATITPPERTNWIGFAPIPPA